MSFESSNVRDEDVETANFLHEPRKVEQPDIPFCGCLSVRYYQPYFDVETSDVTSRLSSALFYCKREQNFLAQINNRPDAYGPFWVSTSLIFVVSVISHINSWVSSWMSGSNWEYNFQSVLTASSLIYGFTVFAPTTIWFVLRQFEPEIKFVNMLCLYGYSLFLFLPAMLGCLIPIQYSTDLALFSAAVASSLFLLRNLAPVIMEHAKKQAAMLMGFVGCIQLILTLLIKFYFFNS